MMAGQAVGTTTAATRVKARETTLTRRVGEMSKKRKRLWNDLSLDYKN